MCNEQNGKALHTDRYEMMARCNAKQLVVRRGAPFNVQLHCNRAFNEQEDTIVLSMVVEVIGNDKISYGGGTVVQLPLASQLTSASDEWSATLMESKLDPATGKAIATVQVFISSMASVSAWNLIVRSRLDSTNETHQKEAPSAVYVLFNPWCRNDFVYLEDDAARQEYVVNDSTLIWRNSPTEEGAYAWNLGQYERDILDCALWIVAIPGRVSPTFRSNPVKVARALTAALSTANGPGVLMGKWFGDLSDGTDPAAWCGSVRILQQYFATSEPVRYGLCWVYAGICATVCRALGIPCRVVTNFESAHEGESSLTVDFFVDCENQTVPVFTDDSVWSYHVWNEVWLKRIDLNNPKYDGWQAIDATPQELSDVMFKLGPAPLSAIKDGEVLLLYDVDLIYSEVNANKIYWSIDNEHQTAPMPLLVDTKSIGKNISTKAIGSNTREDITHQYKYEEGSAREREVMQAVLKQTSQRFVSSAMEAYQAASDAIELELKPFSKNILGQPFRLQLLMKNVTDMPQEISGTLILQHSDYTGKLTKLIRNIRLNQIVGPNLEIPWMVELSYDQYRSIEFDQCCIRAYCIAELKGCRKKTFLEEKFSMESPRIEMRRISGSKPGSILVTSELKNPLPVPLTDASFLFEGSRYSETLEIRFPSVAVNETVKAAYPINHLHKGNAVITVSFVAKELKNVSGHLSFDV
ncbi:annulin-like isoform X2 [Anopheles aquasalis]|nr:annulin-like isoform X2 [Anopheles aquasalis]